MKIRCIDNSGAGAEVSLIVGWVYEMVAEGSHSYTIVLPSGGTGYFCKDRFIKLGALSRKRVRCLDAESDLHEILTRGQVYTVIWENERFYKLEGTDLGTFLKTRFEVLSDDTVINISDFRKKWGVRGENLNTIISDYIRLAPSFPGDTKLASDIGVAMADLESALKMDYRGKE